MERHKAYYDFIKYAIGSEAKVPQCCNDMDWRGLLDFCRRHSIAGVVFGAIEKLDNENIRLPQDVLFEWIGAAGSIKNKNRIIDRQAIAISRFFEEKGYRSCILKGQANATMYPRPELRSPGDIDIWVEGKTEDIIRLALQEAPQGRYSRHHVKMPVFDDTSVEVHYRPIFLDNWLLDRRFKKILAEVEERQFTHRITLGGNNMQVGSLTDDFNSLYQMLHIWHHLLSTRNNLKQLLDYYYLLKRGLTSEEKDWTTRQFKWLGVEKYARGIMWIEQNVLGLDAQYLIVQPDEKIGRLLLRYVLSYGVRHKRSKAGLLIHRVTDNLPLMYHFPSAVLINPLYLIWHQWWKWSMKRKLKRNQDSCPS